MPRIDNPSELRQTRRIHPREVDSQSILDPNQANKTRRSDEGFSSRDQARQAARYTQQFNQLGLTTEEAASAEFPAPIVALNSTNPSGYNQSSINQPIPFFNNAVASSAPSQSLNDQLWEILNSNGLSATVNSLEPGTRAIFIQAALLMVKTENNIQGLLGGMVEDDSASNIKMAGLGEEDPVNLDETESPGEVEEPTDAGLNSDGETLDDPVKLAFLTNLVRFLQRVIDTASNTIKSIDEAKRNTVRNFK